MCDESSMRKAHEYLLSAKDYPLVGRSGNRSGPDIIVEGSLEVWPELPRIRGTSRSSPRHPHSLYTRRSKFSISCLVSQSCRLAWAMSCSRVSLVWFSRGPWRCGQSCLESEAPLGPRRGTPTPSTLALKNFCLAGSVSQSRT